MRRMIGRRIIGMVSGVITALVLIAPCGVCDEQHQHKLTAAEVGSIHFSTSCSKAVEMDFNRAVALLHSFQYEQTREAFSGIAAKDPKCAMAHWGMAMSHYHGLWENGDIVAGRAAVQKAREIAAANAKTTPREKAYIEALGEIYHEDGKDRVAHARAFERKMGELQTAYPDDIDAAVFHALTLDIVAHIAPKSDETLANERKCGEILEPIFKKQPHHPGVAHYIIHCYDDPALAEQGLGAARLYAKIAPASAHANHMPSHIFTRVGLWDDSITSNLKSAALAAKAEATSTNGEARDQRLHAMDYLEYAYLQSGRVKQAKAVLEEMNSLKPVQRLTLTGNYATAAVPARLAIELGNWPEASSLQARDGVPWAQAITWAAIGVGSARTGNLERAKQAEQTLDALRDAAAKQDNPYWSNQIEVQRREVAGWIAKTEAKPAEAIELLKSATELEESMDKSPATPGAVTPAREMLAEMFLLEKHAKESLAEYEAVLLVAPNRFNALYGAASAAESAGNAQAANQYFAKLIRVAVGDERPELATARKKIALSAKRGSD